MDCGQNAELLNVKAIGTFPPFLRSHQANRLQHSEQTSATNSDESCTSGNPSPVPTPSPILPQPHLTPISHLYVLPMVLHLTFYILYFLLFIFYVLL